MLVKHHFVPQFMLRRWCNEAGKLQSFRVLNGKVVCKSVAPEYTGYENALYAVVANVLGIGEDHLEKKFFSPLDSKAAVTLGKIERREDISEDDKIAWAFFLNSLRVRQPDVLAYLRAKGMKLLKKFLAEDDGLLPIGWLPAEQWFEKHYPGMMEARWLVSSLSKMVLHDEMTERFQNLDWWVLEFESQAPKLLLSDLPIHWEGGVGTDSFFIQVPISPDRIFFGTASQATKSSLLDLPRGELIRRINRASLASSSNRIWGSDAKEGSEFIEANLDIVGANVEPFGATVERFIERPRQPTG
jgi:hypothetical protein